MTTAISLRFGACLLASLLFLGPAVARENRRPKFGPYAVPLVQQTGFIRQSPAEDYWTFSQYYLPQRTSSACALASTAMALNFLRGTPKYANQTLITQNELLHTVFTGVWAKKVAKGGAGVRFNELVTLVKRWSKKGCGITSSRIIRSRSSARRTTAWRAWLASARR